MSCSFTEIRHLLPVLVLGLAIPVFGQNDSSSGQAPDNGQQPNSAQAQDNSGAAPAATGPIASGNDTLENPPLSGFDKPRAEPIFGGRSYFVPGVQASEGIETNVAGSNINTVSRALGSVDLQKLWKDYQVGLDYIGGESVFTGRIPPGFHRWYQMHTLNSDQRIPWRTGQLAIRDSFNYLPEGTFGFGSYGGAGDFGSALGAGGVATGLGAGISGGAPTGFGGGGQFIGFAPHVENLTLVDVAQELSPRSTVTLAGGFDVTDFLKSGAAATFNGQKLINSQQTTAQAGYNRTITRSDQIGVLYAFQELHFPRSGSGTIVAHVWNVLYGRRITGRLNFVVGGGPEVFQIRSPETSILLFGIFPVTIPASTTTTISGTASAVFDYTWSARTTLSFGFSRYITAGSGFFAGANTDALRLAMSHKVSRQWTATGDFGFSYNKRLQAAQTGPAGTSTSYQYWYLGASLRRQLNSHFDAFVNYQFNQFTGSSCGSLFCGSHQQIATVGLNWHPSPIRLD